MRECDLGWTAGILDGEGHFGIAKAPNYGIKIAVGNTDVRMLTHLRDLWSGKIYFNACYKNARNAKPFWHWQLHGTLVFALLKEVYPFLVVKQDQALLLLEMEQWHGKRTGYNPVLRDFWRAQRESIHQRLRILTKRGTEERS